MREGTIKCEWCGKEAQYRVFIASKNDRRDERVLCEACARDSERVLFGDSGLPMPDLLKALVLESSVSESEGNRSERSGCPQCGNTREELAESGMLGCSVCYMVFREEVDRLVSELHGSA